MSMVIHKRDYSGGVGSETSECGAPLSMDWMNTWTNPKNPKYDVTCPACLAKRGRWPASEAARPIRYAKAADGIGFTEVKCPEPAMTTCTAPPAWVEDIEVEAPAEPPCPSCKALPGGKRCWRHR